MHKNLALVGSTLAVIAVVSIIMFVWLTPNQSRNTIILQPLSSETIATLHLHNGDSVEYSYTTSGESNLSTVVQELGTVAWEYTGGVGSVKAVYTAGVDGTYEFTFTNPSNVSLLTVTYSIQRQTSSLMLGLTIGFVDLAIALVAVVIWIRGRSRTA